MENNITVNKIQYIKHVIISILSLILLSFGVAIMVKSEIGLAPWDALTATISQLTSLKFGTASILSNFVLIVLQIFILRNKFKLSYWAQIPIIFGFGSVINFFLYQILQFNLSSYWAKLIFFAFGNIVAAFAISFLFTLDIILMPPEMFSSAVDKVSRYKFSNVRLFIDIISVIICLTSTLLFSTTLQIREGTIISIIVFNLSLKIFIKLVGPLFNKAK